MSHDKVAWSVPVQVEDIPETGAHYELVADKATREAVARAAGLRDLAQFEAVFELSRRGAGVALKGEVRAYVGQTCVVSLEPVVNALCETVDLVFVPPSELSASKKRGTEPPEPLENDEIDLGVIATEFLILGLDPYPRKPGVEFAATPAESISESPFAALADFKKRSRESSS